MERSEIREEVAPGSAALHPGYAYPLPALAIETTSAAAPDDRPIAVRLQSAVDRVLPAIEATVARLGMQGMHPREMERAARALASLTRTLRELKGLMGEQPQPADDDMPPRDLDEFRIALAKRIEAFIATRLDARERLMGTVDGV